MLLVSIIHPHYQQHPQWFIHIISIRIHEFPSSTLIKASCFASLLPSFQLFTPPEHSYPQAWFHLHVKGLWHYLILASQAPKCLPYTPSSHTPPAPVSIDSHLFIHRSPAVQVLQVLQVLQHPHFPLHSLISSINSLQLSRFITPPYRFRIIHTISLFPGLLLLHTLLDLAASSYHRFASDMLYQIKTLFDISIHHPYLVFHI